MTAVVLGVDDQSPVGHGTGEVVISQRMFTHTVGDLHGGRRRGRRIPAVGRDRGAVGGGIAELRRQHRAVLPSGYQRMTRYHSPAASGAWMTRMRSSPTRAPP